MLCTCRYSSNTSTTSGETLELVKFDESKEPGCARENLDLLHMCQMQNSSCEKQISTCTGFHFKCTPYARWALLVECAAFTTALQLVSRVSRQLQLHVWLIITIIASGCNLAWRFSGGGMCPYMYLCIMQEGQILLLPPPLLNRTQYYFSCALYALQMSFETNCTWLCLILYLSLDMPLM